MKFTGREMELAYYAIMASRHFIMMS